MQNMFIEEINLNILSCEEAGKQTSLEAADNALVAMKIGVVLKI